MRTRIISIVLLLAATAGYGWHNHQRIATLRATHRDLSAQAATRGIVLDPGQPGIPVRRTKLPRPERMGEAKLTAAEFIAYAEEMHALGRELLNADKETRKRMMDQMNRVTALDGEQLKVLIDEIFAANGTDDGIRRSLLTFSLRRLAKDHPQDALAVLTDSPGLRELLDTDRRSSVDQIISNTVGHWAETHPAEALDWYRENNDGLSEDCAKGVRSSLMWGAATSDPRLLFQLVDEFGHDPRRVPSMLVRDYQTPDSKTACLAPLREWCARIEDGTVREKVYYESLAKLALGKDGGSGDFQTATQWVASAKLTPTELEFFARTDLLDLSYYIKPEEAGQWIEWLGDTFPTNTTSQRISQLFSDSRTRRAAEQWLETAPPSPAQDAAIRSYAAWIARDKPQAAEALLREREVSPE